MLRYLHKYGINVVCEQYLRACALPPNSNTPVSSFVNTDNHRSISSGCFEN